MGIIKKILIGIGAIILLALTALLVLFGCIVYGVKYAPVSKIRELIPEKIVTNGVVVNDIGFSFGGGGDCGGVVFKLSEKTIDDIKKQGLNYFKDISLKDNSVEYRTKIDHWRDWKSSPAITKEDITNSDIPYGCMRNFENYMKENGHPIPPRKSGFYAYVTHRGYSNIWIFPEWNILVYSYWY